MSKKMTLNNLKALESKTYTQRKVILNVEGQDFEITIQEVFKPTSIESSVVDLRNMIDECDALDVEINHMTLSLLSVLKNFTDIKFTNDLKKDLQMFIMMTNLNIVDKIIESFNQDELDKLNQHVQNTAKNLPNIINIIKNETEKIQKAVKNNA